MKFVHVDRSRSVPVDVPKYPRPILDVLMMTPMRIGPSLDGSTYLEDTLKFMERNCATAVRVLSSEGFQKGFPQILETVNTYK